MQASIAMLGLGRMGGNMARRLLRAGHSCVVFDRDEAARVALVQEGATPASDLDEVIARCAPPRGIWMMLPAGEITRQTISDLTGRLDAGDMLIDGGNSHWEEDWARSRALAEHGIDYVDVGVSGGVLGLERGYCLMIGGPECAVRLLTPFFASLAPGPRGLPRAAPGNSPSSTAEQGYLHCGGTGAGHFVKMVHNAIEYGMMQAYAEGFDLMRARGDESLPVERRLALDAAEISELWRRGSVITSWLLDLGAEALAADPELASYSNRVADSGEGRWAMQAAIESGVATPALASAMYARFQSQHESRLANRFLSALRMGFGGHKESG